MLMIAEPQSQLPDPWWYLRGVDEAAQSVRRGLVEELRCELGEDHPLYGKAVDVVARCEGCDDVLVELAGGDLAMTRLTWSGRPERAPAARAEMLGSPSVAVWRIRRHQH
jgi:hypothetical protein